VKLNCKELDANMNTHTRTKREREGDRELYWFTIKLLVKSIHLVHAEFILPPTREKIILL